MPVRAHTGQALGCSLCSEKGEFGIHVVALVHRDGGCGSGEVEVRLGTGPLQPRLRPLTHGGGHLLVPASDIFRMGDKRHMGGTVKLWGASRQVDRR